MGLQFKGLGFVGLGIMRLWVLLILILIFEWSCCLALEIERGVLDRNGGVALVGAVKDASGADVEEDGVVAGAEVVLNGPFDDVGTLVA